MGGLLVFTNRIPNRWVNELLALAGITMVLLAVWKFSSTTLFPGLSALIPVGGTALVIFAGPTTLVGRALALPPATWIGRLSYSLYLWHWPVIVFSEIGLLLAVTPGLLAAQLSLSFALAYLSWRFIETPFRQRRHRWTQRSVFTCAAIAIGVTLAASSVVIAAKGFPQRFTPAQVSLAAHIDRDYEAGYRRGTCFAVEPGTAVSPECLVGSGKRPSVLLIGDSMAAHLWPGLSRYGTEFDLLQATMVGCTPGVYPAAQSDCQRYFRTMLTKWAPEHRPEVVVLAGRWQAFDLESLAQTVDFLRQQGIVTVVVGPPPTYSAQLPRLLVLASRKGEPNLLADRTESGSFEIDAELRRITETAGARYISLTEGLCEGRVCKAQTASGAPMQFDYGHLTPEGSAEVARLILPDLRSALNVPFRPVASE